MWYPPQKVANFTDFLYNLSTDCEVCDKNMESYRLPVHINESELQNPIKEMYLQIKKLLKKQFILF